MYTKLVYTGLVKNITFSADSELIERARARAREQKKTLNIVFREWLGRFAGGDQAQHNYRELMQSLDHVRAGRKFDRDEMNSRSGR